MSESHKSPASQIKPGLEPLLLRLYSDEAGDTHFQTVRMRGAERQSEVSTSIAWWSEKLPVRNMAWRRVVEEAPPTVPHCCPRRQLIVLISGGIEIEVSSGEKRRVAPGEIILTEDIAGKGHITRATDSDARITLMLELGDEELPIEPV